jgi:hypothetical protein
MEVKKEKTFIAKLFGAVFGIICLMFTGAVGYLFTVPATTMSEIMIMVLIVFVMWMSYVGVFVDLNK